MRDPNLKIHENGCTGSKGMKTFLSLLLPLSLSANVRFTSESQRIAELLECRWSGTAFERETRVCILGGWHLRSRSIRSAITLIPLIEDGTRRCDACVERTQSDTAPISSECRLIGHEPASPSLLVFARRSGSMIGASPSLFLHLVQPWRNRGLDSSVARGEWNNRIISSMIKIEQ